MTLFVLAKISLSKLIYSLALLLIYLPLPSRLLFVSPNNGSVMI